MKAPPPDNEKSIHTIQRDHDALIESLSDSPQNYNAEKHHRRRNGINMAQPSAEEGGFWQRKKFTMPANKGQIAARV